MSTYRLINIATLATVGLALSLGPSYAQAPQSPAYSLETAIGMALQNNRDLQEARLGLQSAGEQVREAWGGLFPDINANVRYQRNLLVPETFLPAFIFDPTAPPDELVPVRFGADNLWTAFLTVEQPLFDAGALVGVGTASRYHTLQREVVRGQAQRIATRVRVAYYRTLLAQESVRVIQESIDRTEQTLRETKGLNQAGLASNYDVLVTDVRLANLRPNLRRAANAVAAAERDLSVEVGQGGADAIKVAGSLYQMDLATTDANEGANGELLRLVGYHDALDTSFEALYEVAVEMRSDLRQARLNVQLEDALVKFERTSYYPKLSAFFSLGITSQENGALNPFGARPNERTTSSWVGVRLEIPIFQGFQRSARVEQRELAKRQADVQLRLIEQEAAHQILTAYEALEEAQLRAEAQRGAVGEARRGFDIVTAQYLAGISSQLEVTEGEVLLRQSEFNYAEAVYDYLVAQAALDGAIGVVPLVDAVPPRDVGVSVSYNANDSERGFARHENE